MIGALVRLRDNRIVIEKVLYSHKLRNETLQKNVIEKVQNSERLEISEFFFHKNLCLIY